MKAVFLDLETGGLQPQHPDIQVAAVAIEDWVEVETFESKIRFDIAKADPDALKLNHFDAETWKAQAIPEREVVRQLGAFLRKHAHVELVSKAGNPYKVARLAGHNVASFDAPRLHSMFKRHGEFLPAEIYRPLDTLHRALWWHAERGITPKSFKLGDLCEAFFVELKDSHDALADVRATIALAQKLVQR